MILILTNFERCSIYTSKSPALSSPLRIFSCCHIISVMGDLRRKRGLSLNHRESQGSELSLQGLAYISL